MMTGTARSITRLRRAGWCALILMLLALAGIAVQRHLQVRAALAEVVLLADLHAEKTSREQRDSADGRLVERMTAGSYRELQREARALRHRLEPGEPLRHEPGRTDRAHRFLRKHPELREDLVAVTAQGRDAEAAGLDPAIPRTHLALALEAAADGDPQSVRRELANARQALACAPLSSTAASGSASAESVAGELASLEMMAETAESLLLPSAPAVRRSLCLARESARTNSVQEAVLFLSVARELLGMRPGQAVETPSDPANGDTARQSGPSAAEETPSEADLQLLLETAEAAFQARSPVPDMDNDPAAVLLTVARRDAAAGNRPRAALALRAALNCLGIDDDAQRRLQMAAGGTD